MEQTQSEQIAELAKAMIKVQLGLPGAKKTASNPFYKSNYADLRDCLEAGRETLSKNGLCVIQTMGGTAESPSVITTLLHSSGQWIRGEGSMTPDKKGPQGTGSMITYARRYGYSAIIGLHQEDDDGEGATNRNTKQAPEDTSKAKTQHEGTGTPSAISEPQRKRMFAISKDNGWPESAMKSLLATYGYESSKDVLRDDYENIIKEIEKGHDIPM